MPKIKTNKQTAKQPLIGFKEQKQNFAAFQKQSKAFAQPANSKLNTNIRNKGGR